MDCITSMDELKEIATEWPDARLAVVRCEDDRHTAEPMSWVFLIDEHYDAIRVADDYWSHNETCLDIGVEITTVADFLAGREGEKKGFSVPLCDRVADCEACGKDYAVWRPGVDPWPFCGAAAAKGVGLS